MPYKKQRRGSNWKNYSDQICSCPRDYGVFRQEHRRHPRHYCTAGFKGVGPEFIPNYAERSQRKFRAINLANFGAEIQANSRPKNMSPKVPGRFKLAKLPPSDNDKLFKLFREPQNEFAAKNLPGKFLPTF